MQKTVLFVELNENFQYKMIAYVTQFNGKSCYVVTTSEENVSLYDPQAVEICCKKH